LRFKNNFIWNSKWKFNNYKVFFFADSLYNNLMKNIFPGRPGYIYSCFKPKSIQKKIHINPSHNRGTWLWNLCIGPMQSLK
jgi:hypothetical protein